MNVVISSRTVGTFLGYSPGVIHRLDDGSAWEQVGKVQEYVYRERPGCWIIFDHERHWIDVEGMSGVAEVRRYAGTRWDGRGILSSGPLSIDRFTTMEYIRQSE
jgi:hypothetical protein